MFESLVFGCFYLLMAVPTLVNLALFLRRPIELSFTSILWFFAATLGPFQMGYWISPPRDVTDYLSLWLISIVTALVVLLGSLLSYRSPTEGAPQMPFRYKVIWVAASLAFGAGTRLLGWG